MSVLDSQFSFRVRWEPFLVRPQCPREGVPHDDPEGGDMNNPSVQHLKEVGKELGIEFNFLCPIYPYTVPAHVLLEFAKLVGDGSKQNEVADRLFKSYFTKGRSLEKRHLLKIAVAVGFDAGKVEKFLDDPTKELNIKRRAHEWRAKGVDAVPFFIMNGQSVCCGAQNAEEFISTITKVATRFPLGETSV